MRADCGNTHCRAYQLTVSEFEQLGGEPYSQSFRSRLGLRATKMYAEVYSTKKPKKVRTTTNPRYRNKVSRYPCGVLERAYSALLAEGVRITDLGENRAEKRAQTRSRRAARRGTASLPLERNQGSAL